MPRARKRLTASSARMRYGWRMRSRSCCWVSFYRMSHLRTMLFEIPTWALSDASSRRFFIYLTFLFARIGAGESGKSTILKQMRIIYSRGFHPHERQWWRRIIFHNIIETFILINEAMTDFNYTFDNPDNEVSRSLLAAMEPCSP